MGDLPLHAAIVHIPLGVAAVAPLIAAGLAVALVRGAVDKRSWVIVIALQAVIVLGGLAAMNTGETEEQTVKRVVDKHWIHEHEERAEAFVWSAGVTFAMATSVLLLGPGRVAVGAAVTVLGTLVSLSLAYRTGHAGGELVFKHGAASAYATPDAAADPTNGGSTD